MINDRFVGAGERLSNSVHVLPETNAMEAGLKYSAISILCLVDFIEYI